MICGMREFVGDRDRAVGRAVAGAIVRAIGRIMEGLSSVVVTSPGGMRQMRGVRLLRDQMTEGLDRADAAGEMNV